MSRSINTTAIIAALGALALSTGAQAGSGNPTPKPVPVASPKSTTPNLPGTTISAVQPYAGRTCGNTPAGYDCFVSYGSKTTPPAATKLPTITTTSQPAYGLTVNTAPASGAFQSNHNTALAIKAQMEVNAANSTGQIPPFLSNLQFGSDGLPIFAPPAKPTNTTVMTATYRLPPPRPPSYLTSQSSPPPRTGNPQAVGGIITPLVKLLIERLTRSSQSETGGNMSGDGGEPNSGGNNGNSSSNSSNSSTNAEGPSDGGIYGPNSEGFGRGTETMTNSEPEGGEAAP